MTNRKQIPGLSPEDEARVVPILRWLADMPESIAGCYDAICEGTSEATFCESAPEALLLEYADGLVVWEDDEGNEWAHEPASTD